jgi:hypothetical protein
MYVNDFLQLQCAAAKHELDTRRDELKNKFFKGVDFNSMTPHAHDYRDNLELFLTTDYGQDLKDWVVNHTIAYHKSVDRDETVCAMTRDGYVEISLIVKGTLKWRVKQLTS